MGGQKQKKQKYSLLLKTRRLKAEELGFNFSEYINFQQTIFFNTE